MAQSRTVMAFRKRLKNAGYTNIEIVKIRGYLNKYAIRATEPLGKNYIRTEYTLEQMNNNSIP